MQCFVSKGIMDGQPKFGVKTQNLNKRGLANARTLTAPGSHEKYPSPPNIDERYTHSNIIPVIQ